MFKRGEARMDKLNMSFDNQDQEVHPDFKRAMDTDLSRDYTEEELLTHRKKYFQTYEVKKDETLTSDYHLICNICKTSRFYQRNNFVIVGNCKCLAEKAEKIKQEEIKRKTIEAKMTALKKLKDASLLGPRYRNSRFENLDMDRPADFVRTVARCKKYCENWDKVKADGMGMYLYGDVGTGKTELTACIGNYLLDRSVPVLFTNFLEIGKQIKKTITDHSMTESAFIERLAKVDLLIIDDLGTEIIVKNGERAWIQDKIYDIINKRYINRMPTIFTSNETIPDLVDNCGLMKKTADRIGAMSTAKIELKGVSYRITHQIENSVF